MKKLTIVSIFIFLFSVGLASAAEVTFDFEHGNQGWCIPDWTVGRDDYVGKLVEVTTERFLDQKSALKLECDFPRESWAAAIVEFESQKGLEAGNTIAAKIFLPKKARYACLKARIIVTAGDAWRIMEGKAVPLVAGEWNMLAVKFSEFNSKEASAGSSDVLVTSENIKKIAIRIERDASPWDTLTRYNGAVYITDVVVSSK